MDQGERWIRHLTRPRSLLPLKTVSKPVRSQFGFHLIEITSRKGKKAKGRHILFPIEVTGSHRDQLDAQADSLESLGAERNGSRGTRHRRPRAQVDHRQVESGPGGDEGAAGAVRRAGCSGLGIRGPQPGATSPVIETPFAYYVFRLDSLHPAGVPTLAEIRPAVEHAAREAKKWDLARKMAKDYLKRVEEGSTMAQAATAMKLAHREFGPFSRVNPPLTSPLVVGTAFGLDAGQRSGVLDSKDGIYVLQDVTHTKADSTKFVKELDEYRARAISAARQERVRSYLTALRGAAKIVDNRDKVLRAGTAQDPSSAL